MRVRRMFFLILCLNGSILIALSPVSIWAGQTGKISGKIIDSATNEPLPGVNVVIEGTNMGAATDLEGEYVILNISPGTYALKVSMIGYAPQKVVNVKVSVDLTTRIDVQLSEEALAMEEIIITASVPIVQKDLTATVEIIRSEEIQQMAVQELNDILQLQAGITTGADGELHIRGGRSSEIIYLLDGVPIVDPFDGSRSLEIENDAIEQIQVIAGGFNAEYGQALSGVVDIVSKEGGDDYHGEVSFYGGDYISFKDDNLNNIKQFDADNVFDNIDDISPTDIFNLQGNLSGPVPLTGGRVKFFSSVRYLDSDGWLYGTRVFNPSDSSLIIPAPNFDQSVFNASGDGKKVSMNSFRKISSHNNLSFNITPLVKFRLGFIWDDIEQREFDEIRDLKERGRNHAHFFRLNPDGYYRQERKDYTITPSISHTLSASTFYTVKFSYSSFDFKEFVFEDPFDERYPDPKLNLLGVSGQGGFLTGGAGMWHEYRNTQIFLTKFDLTSQVNKVHQIKVGVDFKRYDLSFEEFEIIHNPEDAFGIFVPHIPHDSTFNHNTYEHKPIEFSGYLQDKIELDNMIVNIGVRYDYLAAKGVIPNDLSDPNGSYKRGEVTSSSVKSQISPRFGISYPISDRGAVHFSYGFFFQRPNFKLLYLNPEFEIDKRVSGRVTTVMGNADLKNEKTINYELGLQQQFGDDIGFSLTTYYKDINNLIGTEILAADEKYARFINLDFGNVVGISTSLSLRRKNLSVFFDYTFQVAEGNASDPQDQFSDAASVPATESEIQTVPLDWDQTHTVNLSVNFGQPKSWSVGLIGKMGSGLPYTPTSRATRGFRETFENSERKPFQLNFDLQASKHIHVAGLRYTFFAKIFNVLDRRNENEVFADTGDADRTLSIFSTGGALGLNTLEEFFLRPDFFSEPRRVQLGFKVGF